MTDLKLRDGDQPLPMKNDAKDIQSQVITDIEARRLVGISRYRTALQPHNGRDALRDLYEELLDGAMYVKQAMVERDQPIDGVVLAEMKAELQRKDDLIAEFRRQREPLLRSVETLRAERNKLLAEKRAVES